MSYDAGLGGGDRVGDERTDVDDVAIARENWRAARDAIETMIAAGAFGQSARYLELEGVEHDARAVFYRAVERTNGWPSPDGLRVTNRS